MNSGKQLRQALFLLVLLAGSGWYCLHLMEPPAALPASASPAEFSAGRALEHVRAIARVPHPPGTAAHEEARRYIIRQLTGPGVEIQEHDTTWVDSIHCRSVGIRNVIGRWRGRQTASAGGRAVLLAAHYDSVPSGPGASDDASAVAVLLETLRALKSSVSLQNDLILLFTDAEELGLHGARAFQARHPWAREVGLVLNFEARGHRGPVYAFETGAGNRPLVEKMAAVLSRPASSSLMVEVYHQLPNDTDFTIFREAGLPGINFAFIGGQTHYHTIMDTAANLNPASLQHAGQYCLELCRQLGNENLADFKSGPEAVFFDLGGRWLIHYGFTAAYVLAGLAVLAWLGIFIFSVRRQQASLPKVATAVFLHLLSLALAAGAAWLALTLSGSFNPPPAWLGDRYNTVPFSWGVAFTVVLLAGLVQQAGRKWLAGMNLCLGGQLLWTLVAAGTVIYLPRVSFLTVWPLLASLAGTALVVLFNALDEDSWLRVLLAGLAGLPVILIMLPQVSLLPEALGFRGILFPALAIAFMLILLVLPLESLSRPWKGLLPVLALLAAAAGFITGIRSGKIDAARPEACLVFYGLNADAGQASWISFDPPDEKIRQLLGNLTLTEGTLTDFFPGSRDTVWRHPAPVPELPRSRAELKTCRWNGREKAWEWQLLIHAAPESFATWMELDSAGAPKGVLAGGTRLEWTGMLDARALPPDGLEVTVLTEAAGPLAVKLKDLRFGWPVKPGEGGGSYPPGLIPAARQLAGNTMVVHTTRFTAPPAVSGE